MSRHFLIIETGQPIAALRRFGGFAHWIRCAAGLSAQQVHCVAVHDGGVLPDSTTLSKLTGVLITGSAAMVTQRLDWSETCAAWLQQAHAQALPLFGICYGHQLLAHAFGGVVDDNPAGREMGTVSVQLHPYCADDALFADVWRASTSFAAHTTHLQTVRQPPPGAVVLARSDKDDCQAFRYGTHVWGVQFHPEFSVRHMRGYVQARGDALLQEGQNPQALKHAVRATAQARQLLRRFVGYAQSARQVM